MTLVAVRPHRGGAVSQKPIRRTPPSRIDVRERFSGREYPEPSTLPHWTEHRGGAIFGQVKGPFENPSRRLSAVE
jgi:hypothetical protein